MVRSNLNFISTGKLATTDFAAVPVTKESGVENATGSFR